MSAFEHYHPLFYEAHTDGVSGGTLDFDRLESNLEQLSPLVHSQLARFFDLQRENYQRRGIEINPMVDWAKLFTTNFLVTRIHRSEEIQSPDIVRAQELSRAFIGENTNHYIATCMDGRIPLAVPMSHVPHVGGVLRSAAGDFEGFKDGVKPKTVIIDHEAYTAESIRRLLRKKGTVHYSFDSHFGCKARGDSEKIAGSKAKDQGLATDIKRKMNLARGAEKIREELVVYGEEVADLYTQFYSYDPHDGTMTMGLEMHAEEVGPEGFSSTILSELAHEGKIVSTWQLLHDATIANLLRDSVKPSDFRKRFAESMKDNWETITALYEDGEGFVYQDIIRRLQYAYVTSGWTVGEQHDMDNKQISITALENKAKIMLKNLVTRWSIAQDNNGEHDWPFSQHLEQGVVFTEGGYGPFEDLDVFAVFSKGELLNHAYKAVEIVRALRDSGAVRDPVGFLPNRDDFVNAPVMILNKGIVRSLSPEAWSVLESLNLQRVFERVSWDDGVMEWDQNDFDQHLNVHEGDILGGLSQRDYKKITQEMYEVFDRVRRLMGDERFRPLLIRGSVMVCSLLSNEDRMPKVVLPLTI
ncbi:hypothetical protein HY469_04090 [Candidatus Roizmanbacteria bacterium]|nr:hypothetical protein [Candidatus Roizmanbacteria bacterium]